MIYPGVNVIEMGQNFVLWKLFHLYFQQHKEKYTLKMGINTPYSYACERNKSFGLPSAIAVY